MYIRAATKYCWSPVTDGNPVVSYSRHMGMSHSSHVFTPPFVKHHGFFLMHFWCILLEQKLLLCFGLHQSGVSGC